MPLSAKSVLPECSPNYLPALMQTFSLVSPHKKEVEMSAAQTCELFMDAKTKAIQIVSIHTTPEWTSSGGTSGVLLPPQTNLALCLPSNLQSIVM